MKSLSYRIGAAAACLLAVGAAAGVADAQSIPVELPNVIGPPAAATLNAQQLDQILAPVALYPDPLLTDILAAATYPAQIVEAERFVSDTAQARLSADALMDAGAGHDWDPSVRALLPFRQVLALLDTRLEWTDRLGRAFLAQPDDVLNAVQRLRQRAQAAGTLTSGLQDDVTQDGGAIAILPPSPQTMAVPSYDPACVYGGDAGCAGAAPVDWDDAVFLPFSYGPRGGQRAGQRGGQWGWVNWRDRRIHCRVGGEPGPDRHVIGIAPDGDRAGVLWRHDDRPARAARLREAATPFQYAPPAGERPALAALPPRIASGGEGRFDRPGGFRGVMPADGKATALHHAAAAGPGGHMSMVEPPGRMAGAGIGRR